MYYFIKVNVLLVWICITLIVNIKMILFWSFPRQNPSALKSLKTPKIISPDKVFQIFNMEIKFLKIIVRLKITRIEHKKWKNREQDSKLWSSIFAGNKLTNSHQVLLYPFRFLRNQMLFVCTFSCCCNCHVENCTQHVCWIY